MLNDTRRSEAFVAALGRATPRLEAGDRTTFRTAIRPPEQPFVRVEVTFEAATR